MRKRVSVRRVYSHYSSPEAAKLQFSHELFQNFSGLTVEGFGVMGSSLPSRDHRKTAGVAVDLLAYCSAVRNSLGPSAAARTPNLTMIRAATRLVAISLTIHTIALISAHLHKESIN